MLIYYLLYFICFFVAYSSNHIKSKKTKEERAIFVGWFCFLLLTMILSLRHQNMGVDLRPDKSYGYLGMYDYIGRVSWDMIFHSSFLNYEKGYVVLCKLLSYFSKDRQFFIAAVAFLSIFPICYIVVKRSKSPFFSFIVYMGLPLIQLLFSGLRQDIAIGLCFLSTEFIRNKKPLLFCLLVLLAASIHSSAFIFLIAYPVYYIKLKRRTRFISIMALLGIYAFRYPLFGFLTSAFRTSAEISDTGAFKMLLILIGLYIFCMFFSDDSQEQIGYLNLFYIACVFQCFSGVNTLVMRLGFYFMTPIIILLPNVIKGMNNQSNLRLSRDAFMMFFSIYGLYVLSSASYALSNPYYFYWMNYLN